MRSKDTDLSFNSLEPSVVSDVDEILFDAATKHAKQLYQYALDNGWDSPVPPEDFFKKGGSHASYGHVTEYWALNEFMINDPEFNSDLELIPGAVDALNFLAPHLLVYLTTRPESLTRLTEEELEKNGFPKREVIARPKAISIKNTTEWKLDVLTQLAKEKYLLMIDDSYSLFKAILKAHNNNLGPILFRGLITPPHSYAKDWKQITELPCWSKTLNTLNYPSLCNLAR